MTKKFYKKTSMFCTVKTKETNWEILIKNLVC